MRTVNSVVLSALLLTSSCASFMNMFDEGAPTPSPGPKREPQSRPVDMPEGEVSRCEATKIPMMRSTPASRRMESVKHFSYSHLHFPSFENQLIDRVEFTLQLCNVPEPRPYGMYYQIYMKIGGNPLYFGIQTRLLQPGKGSRGPGFIFSRWGELRGEDLRTNSDGFYEIGKHEGGFVGVRLPHAIEATSYVFELVREKDSWYQLFVTPYGEEAVWVGSLRLLGNRGLSDFTLTTEAYAMNGVSTLDIPYWHLLAGVPTVNGIAAHHAYVTYPTQEYPFGSVQMQEASSEYDDAIGEAPFLNVTYGGRSERLKDASGRLEFP